jgi:CubicO group peptidase (beta-lactamase class C family)
MLTASLKKLTLAAFLGICISNALNAQALKQGKPEMDGFSTDRLQHIDSLLNSYTKDHKIAGLGAIVTRHGHIDYWAATGYSDIKAGKLLKKTDMFRIASQT